MADPAATILVTPHSRLTLSFDLEERIARARPEDTIKGMFFQRILDAVRDTGLDPDAINLEAAPLRLRYLAFYDYPVADYFRLVAATAAQLFPRETISEGIRRVAGADFAKFADSKVGRVMLAFTGDALSTLAKSGSMYRAVLKGGAKVEAERTSDGVTIQYRNFPALVETYPIGTIESTLRHYGMNYEIEIQPLGRGDAEYRVRVL